MTDLLASAAAPEVRAHAASCPRCRALVPDAAHAAAPLSEAPRPPLHAWPPEEREAPTLRGGAVFAATAWGHDEHLVCVATSQAGALVDFVPVNDDLTAATDRDLLLGPRPLGYPAIVEAWLPGTLLIEQVDRPLGLLDDDQWDDLCALLDAIEDGVDVDAAVPVGPPILSDDDPRWGAQLLESERVRPFLTGAAAVRGLSTLPTLISRRVEDIGVSVAELDARFGPRVPEDPHWVTSLVEDRLDIQVDADLLSELLVEIRVAPSTRLIEIVACTVTEAHARRCQAASEDATYVYVMHNGGVTPEDRRKREAFEYGRAVVRALAQRHPAPLPLAFGAAAPETRGDGQEDAMSA